MELVKAATRGDVKKLTRLLKRRRDVAQYGVLALLAASRQGHARCVAKLIKAGTDINKMDSDGMTALNFACENGHLRCAQLLINAGGNEQLRMQTCRSFGVSALVTAAKNGQKACLSWLCRIGIDVNGRDSEGMTALVCASAEGYSECVEVLIHAGANVNLHAGSPLLVSATTALIAAAEHGHLECIDILVRSGADVNLRNSINSSALICAISKAHTACVKYLADLPDIEFHATGDGDYPAIFETVKRHRLELLEFLLKCKHLDVDARGPRGETIVIYSVIGNRVEYSPLYLQLIFKLRKVDINAIDVYGKTALIYAVERGDMDSVRLILRVSGVDVNITFAHLPGLTPDISPLIIACNSGNAPIFLALLKAGAKFESTLSQLRRSPLMLVASMGNVRFARNFIQSGFSVVQCDDNNRNALYFAAQNGNIRCLKVLLEEVPDCEKTNSSMQNLFLESAKYSNIFTSLPFLLSAKIFDWNWYPKYCKRALRSLVKVLVTGGWAPEEFLFDRLEHGVETCTPLLHAFYNSDAGLVRYLFASLYLTSRDLHCFQRDSSLRLHVSQAKCQDIKDLHENLCDNPWRLETLSFLTVSTHLRKDENRHDIISNSQLQFLLPEKIQKRLAFRSKYRWLDVSTWDNIQVNSLDLDLKRVFHSDTEAEVQKVELKRIRKRGVKCSPCCEGVDNDNIFRAFRFRRSPQYVPGP